MFWVWDSLGPGNGWGRRGGALAKPRQVNVAARLGRVDQEVPGQRKASSRPSIAPAMILNVAIREGEHGTYIVVDARNVEK